MILADINEILDWPVGLEGWHVHPETGTLAKIGNHCHGKHIEIESCFRVGSYFHVGDNFKVGVSFHADKSFYAGRDFKAGSYFRSGSYFQVGDHFQAGDNFYAGDHFQAGYDFKAGENFKVGHDFNVDDGFNVKDYFVAGSRFRAGKCFRAGYSFHVGSSFKAGDNFNCGDYFDSLTAAESIRRVYRLMGEKIIFVKWVKKLVDGVYVSPLFDGGSQRVYEIGKRIIDGGERDDQQCAPGLHVMLPGVRPEWLGYCSPDHDLVALLVEVRTKDILFAGWSGCAEKFRVSSLVPIREL